MRFQVPQFIETETKLVGPFTLRQFLYIGSGAALILILQFVISSTGLIVVTILIGTLAVALAYAKIDGVSLPRYFVMALKYLLSINKYRFEKNDTSKADELTKK